MKQELPSRAKSYLILSRLLQPYFQVCVANNAYSTPTLHFWKTIYIIPENLKLLKIGSILIKYLRTYAN